MYLEESFDKIYPITRMKPSSPWVLDEWHFEVGSKVHVVRAAKVSPKLYGRRACMLIFGIKKGKTVSKKLTGVNNIRQYIATIIAAIEKMHEDPTTKMKTKGDGLVLSMDEDIFDKRGRIFSRALRVKLREKYKIHKSYNEVPSDETQKAIYLWKKEKTFVTIFPELGVGEDAEEDDTKPETVVDVKDMIKRKLDSNIPEVKPDEPVANRQLNDKPKETSFADKQKMAKEDAPVVLKEKKVNVPSYLKVAVLYTFFSKSFGSDLWEKDTSLDISSANISKENVLDYIKKLGNFTGELEMGLPSEYECLLALNMSNIKTGHIYDLMDRREKVSNHFLKTLDKMGVDRTKLFENISVAQMSNVSIDKIVDICMNAKSILREKGFVVNPPEDSPYGRRQVQDVRAGRTLYAMISDHDFSGQEIEDIFNSVLASIDPIEIENVFPFKYEKSEKGSKTVKELKYDFF